MQDAFSEDGSNSGSLRLRRASSLTDLVIFSSPEPSSPRRKAQEGTVITPEPADVVGPEENGEGAGAGAVSPVGQAATVPRSRPSPKDTHAMPEWRDPAMEERFEAARQFRCVYCGRASG